MESKRVCSRHALIHGAVMMVTGLLWGALIGATPYPRLALGAHIQFTTNGLMFLVAGLVIAHAGIGRGRLARKILLTAPWGVWAMAVSEAANAWWGASKTLPLAAELAGASGAGPVQEIMVLVAHILGATAVLAYWVVILVALFKETKPSDT